MDRFIVGEGCDDGVEYLIHTQFPRFICKIGAEEGEGILSGLNAELSIGETLYDFDGPELDEISEADFHALMEEASEAILRDAEKHA